MISSTRTTVAEAITALRQGEMIIVVDDADRENEGDLIVAAEFVTSEQMAFIVRHTTGIVCAAMSGARADRLELPLMVRENTDTHHTAFTVTVDHVDAGTGVSAPDRALTARALSDPHSMPHMLRRPGHVFPLRAREGGVLERPGHTEAAVDLTTLAGLSGVGIIAEIIADDGTMRRGGDLKAFADVHGLPLLSVADLVEFRRNSERSVTRSASTVLPTQWGEFQVHAYRSEADGTEHVVLCKGDIAEVGQSDRGVLVRVHSECLTGDVLKSRRCDCGTQLDRSLAAIAEDGCGLLIYLQGHEGRGIGLVNKIRAYELQDQGLDTVDANTVQGLPVDARSYEAAARILTDLQVQRIRLITNNPTKTTELQQWGIDVVERVSHAPVETPHNRRYLQSKRDRLGHLLQTNP
ncbi:bifunctional 3,4-dihydroxy-2-butanone-4-phosphate synthase/GTP cyclohydrolase II [Rhodococcus sp. HM1]|uniref:bifunctional 3,4-dihydroxy-2-butanone-4-phosphate synthase/GTP cyclohydrolase II n=1 Tax=Rhodococcus sp. HM1 TaxID=2937759 RepID=UPI00200A704B|nr:bifunctional 3,4-dihydroxy-2-butanone-4-phosphate synthase/GTP cyclohydrolase II [Rhodococcus sp. HM1]MCK8671551.1 bifunctional 3,4-dihydroxy-2-butanone-4-phosphate synthase/GTP cyclohydrolase II [Rhodococcus sp. HM1]